MDNYIQKNIVKAKIELSGLSCSSCVRSIEQNLEKLPGVLKIHVNLLMSNATLEFDQTQITLDRITQTIRDAGYKVEHVNIVITQQQDPSLSKSLSNFDNVLSVAKKASDDTMVEDYNNNDKINASCALQKVPDLNITNMIPPSTSTNSTRTMATVRLEITGMTCASCVSSVQAAIEGLDGVENTQVNLLTNEATVKYNPNKIGTRDLVEAVTEVGFEAKLISSTTKNHNLGNTIRERAEREQRRLKDRFLMSLWFAIPTFVISMIFMTALPASNDVRMAFMKQIIPGLGVGTLILFLLATPVQLYLGGPFYVKAWKSLYYARVANMDTLVTIGTTIAYVGSIVNVVVPVAYKDDRPSQQFFETSVLLFTFILLGRWMEAKAKGKTFETITKLMELQPDKAVLVKFNQNGKVDDSFTEHEIDSDLIQVDDILKVNAGGRIPCDDESTITGESIPVSKGVGDIVISATVNQTSSIWIKATRVGTDTTISRIINLVQEAQSSKKAPIEEFADKVSHIFVPVVIGIALSVFIVWVGCGGTGRIPSDWLGKDQNYVMFSLFFAISVMVVACPCAMGLASPTAIMVGTGIAAKLGILIKGGGEAIELANKINVIAFDKTGTLTFGKPKVIDKNLFYPKDPLENARQCEQLLMRIIGLVESSSDHPLAKAVSQYVVDQNTTDRNPSNVTLKAVREAPGKGLKARVKVDSAPPNFFPADANPYYNVFIGNERWLFEHNCIYPSHITKQEAKNTLRHWKLSGSSVVLVGLRKASEKKGGLILAQFAVADTPRSDAAKT
ncbi:7567_t:CDS:2, partial [Ambispora gerdemannii]